MALRTVVTLTVSSLLTILVAACGSASTTTSTASTSASAPSSSATADSASVAPASAPAQSIPPGFTRYKATGFSFLAPSGMKPAPDGGISGLPPGASAATLTPGGRRLESTNTQIIEGINPHLHADLDQVATSLEAADSGNRALRHVQTSVSTMTVPGAQDVRIVSERYIGPAGGHASTLFRRTWLMVSPRPGVLMDLVVVVEPQRGGTLNPATVLDSFRLAR